MEHGAMTVPKKKMFLLLLRVATSIFMKARTK